MFSSRKKEIKRKIVSKSWDEVQETLTALIRVLYGLALVSGAKTAADYYFAPNHTYWSYLPLVGVALLVGLSDWLMYHFVALDHPYTGIPRLLADILFPIGIFGLFYAARDLSVFLAALGLYFLGCVVYLLVIRDELKASERWLLTWPPLFVLILILIVAFTVKPTVGAISEYVSTGLVILGSVIWITVNLVHVKRRLGHYIIEE